ncbi:hypothetical protein AVEN_264872-1 [Araneus ventricosus]|uniref:Uncharacterized protein n=1 Tax=Araneus ventricosus TaxID=182803 RepID=A0A4Y2GNM8_ARAVE|nr:hypothetical protein AVEN_264872-1 [Araneus ventricosus]
MNLDSPNLGCHHHHTTPCYNIPLRRTEMGCGWQGNWTPYRAYLRSGLRTLPPLKRRQPPQIGFRRWLDIGLPDDTRYPTRQAIPTARAGVLLVMSQTSAEAFCIKKVLIHHAGPLKDPS